MKNDLTDVYAILKKEFGDDLRHFGLDNSKELASFLHYNAHNEMFVNTDEEYYHNVNFKNLDTGKASRVFREGRLYFLPKGDDFLKPDNIINAFSIGRYLKSIVVNDNGLFVEKCDLNGNIITQYYDMAALSEIANHGLSFSNIDYIEDHIQGLGIAPDRVITVGRNNDHIMFSVVENEELIQQEQIDADEKRTLYSCYYEFMKANNYYDDTLQQGIHM